MIAKLPRATYTMLAPCILFMFHFSPYSSLGSQRKALLSAEAFAPMPLHPALERQLKKAKQIDGHASERIDSKTALFTYTLRELSDLVSDIVLWTVLNALIVLGAVFVTREVIQAKGSVVFGLSLACIFFLLKAAHALVEYRTQNSLRQVHRGVQLALYRVVNEKLSRIAPAGRLEFSKGQLKTLVGSDVEAIEDFISAALIQWTRALVSSLIVIPALWFVSGWPGVIALGVVLALIPIAAIGAAYVERFQIKAQAEQDTLVTAIGEWVKNIRLVRFLGWDRAIEAEVNLKMWRFIVRAALRHTAVLVVWAISYSWWMMPLLAIFAFSPAQSGSLNLVEVFSSFWLLDHLMSQIQYIPHSLSLFGAASAGATRVLQLLRQPELNDAIVPCSDTAIAPGARPTKLKLRNVTVRYGSYEAIRNLSVEISLAQRTVIIGAVGSGKSTLLEALLGELPISSGSIEVEFSDGSCGSLWRQDIYAAFRKEVAYSPQQPFLSNATMRDNIDLSGEASFDDVQQAVALSQLDEDLALFRRGLVEEVGESGINLSGGQKQRVSLARAFISKRSIWILDDPLSAVDTHTEQKLLDAITSQVQGLILVSHRISALERCDRVLVLENGLIAEDGDPQAFSSDSSSRVYRFLQAVEEHGS